MYQTLISAEHLLGHLNHPNWMIFDCRFDLGQPDLGHQEYLQSHIPGAYYADLDKDLAVPKATHSGRHPLPSSAAFIDWLGEKGVSQDKQIVVYDHGPGAIATRLWWMLRWLGHESVALLDGGWNAWVAQGCPTDAILPEPQPAQFEASLNANFWVTTEQLKQGLENQEILLLDARTRERFRGQEEPIDPIAGHIPGAINAPFMDNLDKGQFKSTNELSNRFSEILGERKPQEVVHMCGSGVTACHNILAMEAAGFTGSRLYVGSWSEWIADPSRPIASGTE